MTKKANKPKYKVGIIVAIPLPDGRFAYAKVFNDFDLGVYDLITDSIKPIENVVRNKILFFQPVTDSAIRSGKWPIIGEEPFSNEDSTWGPPRAAGALPQQDLGIVNPLFSYKGKTRPAKIEELVGLDIEFFCQRPELFIEVVVDRLVNNDHTKYRVQL